MKYENLLRLRLIVGYLGEKAQLAWWQSSFLDPNAKAFLQPSFPRTWRLSQYHGVIEAALRVHDEFIGIGRVYHLFRLPEEMEHSLHDAFQASSESPFMEEALASREVATEALQIMARGRAGLGEGPEESAVKRIS